MWLFGFLLFFSLIVIAYYAWKELKTPDKVILPIDSIKRKPLGTGGSFGLFGLTDWFCSLPKEEQELIFKYYKNFTTDPDDLINGEIYYTSNTGAKLLINLAHTAFQSKNHALSDKLKQKAYELIKNKDDYDHCRAVAFRIIEERSYTPDQIEIEAYKMKVLNVVKEKPGILQSDIKKLFSDKEGVLVGHALSQLKYEEKIRREKKGRSFQLYIKEVR